MVDIDIPDGPKTPSGMRRLANIAIISMCVIVTGSFFGLPWLEGIGNFLLANLLDVVFVVGILVVGGSLYQRVQNGMLA